MMVPRLELLRELLAEDGSIWVTIDDHEAHYLKVVMDEIFGRGNFVANAIWQKKYAPQNDAKWLSDDHDHVFCYAKHKETWRPYALPRTEAANALYKNPDNDPRGAWMSDNLSVKTYSAATDYPIVSPQGKTTNPPPGRCWIYSREKMQELIADNRIWFGAKGTAGPRLKKFLSDVKDGIVCRTLWLRDQTGDNQEARREVRIFNIEDIFQTPKPEKLLQRILTLSTQENDLVLDSFLGSGTTAAVAHKMHRRYIGIELGEHARTHCAVRLQKVIEGEQGGISKAVNWQGGGGFRFYTLGAELFSADGKLNPQVTFTDLAAYIWFFETRTPYPGKGDSPLLGVHENTAYYLLFNGILKDRSAAGGNILTAPLLAQLPGVDDRIITKTVIYALGNRLSADYLAAHAIDYRHIPHQVPRMQSGKKPGKRKS